MKTLLTWLGVLASSISLSAAVDSPSSRCKIGAMDFDELSRAVEHGARSESLPLEAQFAVSATLGKDQPTYYVLPMTQAKSAGEQASYQAANPNQNFKASFDAQGACLISGSTHWNLSVLAWGYGDPFPAEPENATAPAPLVSANRAEYRRGALTEWYLNGPLGLQQGFTLQAPPARNNAPDNAPLTFVLNLPEGTSQVDADRTGLTLLTDSAIGGSASGGKKERTCPQSLPARNATHIAAGGRSSVAGRPSLRYSGLTAFDADGHRLRAWLEPTQNKLLVCVDDRGARYPIVIDPFIQQAKLITWDGAKDDYFGVCVALSSNGNTAIVGAYWADVGTNNNQGAAYVFTRAGASWNLQKKLTAADGAKDDLLGYFVALSGDGNTAIAGASSADVGTNYHQGAAYVFTRSGNSWSQQEKLTASDGAANDNFGISVALSGDGNTVIVGADFADVGGNDNQGTAYVFTRSGSAWSQQTKLTASDGAGGERFGICVALNSDGNTAIIGADWADIGANNGQGAVYIFTRSGSAWSQQAKLTANDGAANDGLGWTVSLSSNGDTAIAGAYSADVGTNIFQGTAYVFTRSNAVWMQQAKLTASDGTAGDGFGNSVALSSDGNKAFLSSHMSDVGGDNDQGAAYVFTRSGTNWSQQAKLTASDGAANDSLTISLALSSDGNTAIAGAFKADVGGITNQGAAYVFTSTGAVWSQQAKLIANYGAAGDVLGISAALNSDGNTALVGAYLADLGGNNKQGAAYVFARTGAVWSQQEKLIAADGAATDYFGYAVALSSNGNTGIIGAYGANTGQGAAYIFTRSGTAWSQQEKLIASDGVASNYFGYSLGLSSDGGTAIAGSQLADVGGNANQGAAYLFTRSGSSWSEQAKLTANDGAINDLFGVAVSLSDDGNTAIAGATYADVGGNGNQGAAYIFTRSGTAWSQQAKLTADDGTLNNLLGISVALNGDGDTAIAGASYANVGGNTNQGTAYVFTRSGAAWSQQAKLTSADGAARDFFGTSVNLSGDGNTAIAGAYFADVNGNADQGAAYLFTRSGNSWSQQEKLTAGDGAMGDYFGYAAALSSDGSTVIVGANGADVFENVNQGAAYVFALPSPPTGVAASYDFYIDRVRVSWDPATDATGYGVWRGASNDTAQATNIATGITVTNYDDTTATAGTPYYYWVKTTTTNGVSIFSASALGRVLLGPDVRINGEAGPVSVTAGSQVVVTVSMGPAQYAGYPVDWWMVASTPMGLYYVNSNLAWTTASDLSALQPAYQGGLFELQSGVVVDTTALPAGIYTFYFGVDTLNGSLDPDVIYDSATVIVTP